MCADKPARDRASGAIPEDFSEALEQSSRRFEELVDRPHDDLGLVLKCHLIVEEALRRFLVEAKNLKNLADAKLSFAQMTALIDDTDGPVYQMKSGVKQLNALRNKFGHNLHATLAIEDIPELAKHLDPFLEGVDAARHEMREFIEGFLAETGQQAEESGFKLILDAIDNDLSGTPGPIQVKDLRDREPREIIKFFAMMFSDDVTIQIWRTIRGSAEKDEAEEPSEDK